MTPTTFKFANRTLTAPLGRPEVLPLPIYTDEQQCISLWTASWIERLKVLLFGRVWLCVQSGPTQPPVWISVDKEVLKYRDD